MANGRFSLIHDAAFRGRRKLEELIARQVAKGLASVATVGVRDVHGHPLPGPKEMHIEAGIVYPAALMPPMTLQLNVFVRQLVPPVPFVALDYSTVRIVDRCGHTRAVYRPLLVYSLTQSFALLRRELPHERSLDWRALLKAWQVVLMSRAKQLPWREWPATAARGADFAEAACIALALHTIDAMCGAENESRWAEGLFESLVSAQQASGAFLKSSPADNPETTGYHELLILHAAASAAVQLWDAGLLDAVRRGAAFHSAEMQPDHATNQPWALFAFMLDSATFPVAESLIHTATAQLGEQDQSLLALMLMADALYCLERVRGP